MSSFAVICSLFFFTLKPLDIINVYSYNFCLLTFFACLSRVSPSLVNVFMWHLWQVKRKVFAKHSYILLILDTIESACIVIEPNYIIVLDGFPRIDVKKHYKYSKTNVFVTIMHFTSRYKFGNKKSHPDKFIFMCEQ